MSTSEQEMNEALDALEAEHGVEFDADQDNIEQEDIAHQEDVEIEEEPKEEQKEKPPGYLTYDEWVAKGKDPADYKGENAYKAEYDRITEIRELKDTMSHVVNGIDEWKQQQSEQMAQQVEQARLDAIAELNAAKEDDDIEGALAAQDKINKLNSQPTPEPVNPVITTFAKSNPIIDKSSTQYDADFHQDMIMIHNGKLDQLLGGDRSRAGELTQEQVDRVQRMAFNQAKELHQDKFVSPRNKRVTSTPPSRRTATTTANYTTKLKQVGGSSSNPRDTNAANEIYEMIKAKDPAAAETYAKNVLGE